MRKLSLLLLCSVSIFADQSSSGQKPPEKVSPMNDWKKYHEVREKARLKKHLQRDVTFYKKIIETCDAHKTIDRTICLEAKCNLADEYWHGGGAPVNKPEGCKIYGDILKNYADLDAPTMLAWAKHNIADGFRNGWCAAVDWSKAVPLYQEILNDPKLSEMNTNLVAWTQARLADAYRDGNGIDQDYTKAFALYESVFKNDENIEDKSIIAWAKYWMAVSYREGQGVGADAAKAHTLFEDIAANYTEIDPIAVAYAQNELKKENQRDAAS